MRICPFINAHRKTPRAPDTGDDPAMCYGAECMAWDADAEGCKIIDGLESLARAGRGTVIHSPAEIAEKTAEPPQGNDNPTLVAEFCRWTDDEQGNRLTDCGETLPPGDSMPVYCGGCGRPTRHRPGVCRWVLNHERAAYETACGDTVPQASKRRGHPLARCVKCGRVRAMLPDETR